ncbi:MAG: N-6 DNA methylase [Sedimentisphaerales bacterium]
MAAVNKSKSYYHNTLEPLFFEVLNTPAEERAKDFTSKPWLIIPFLNGGLFTPHEDDYYGSNEQQKTQFANILQIPDNWLRDLLGIFETYNFTIDENTPVDVELSIDPEMLGRIFENLLAEINPETGETARKATGSYYTRRPIVEYMVDESLKQYLLTKTGLPEEKILPLLSYSDESTTLSEADKNTILDVLDTIKIIDPACGSGAFPMGILQKILLILQKIDTDSQKWLNKILSKIENVTARKEFEKKLKKENWNYVHKLGIVQSSIYGVDIQQIAVEISKLRFFLSLIVDENVSDKEPNRAVKPLPNLEFKFVCANTLIGLPNHGRQQTMFEDEDSISELKRLRDEYLNSYGKEKKDLEDRFRKVQSKMFEHSLNWGGKETQTAKLSQWNPFLGEPCGWFDPEWMFGIIEGFDIVIANPPYATNYARKSIKTIHSYMKKLAEVYEFSKNRSSKRYNLTMFFLEKATHICSVEGLINMIVDAGFDVTVYREIRKYLLDQTTLLEKVENLEAFENVNSRQTILMLRNGRIEKSEFRLKEGTAGVAELVSQQECIDSENSIIGGIRKDSIIDKMEMGSSNIDELYYPISGMNVTNRPESGLPPFLSSERLNANYHKAIFSGNISAYRITYPISEQLESSNSRKYLYICYDRKLAKKMNKYLEERGERSRVSIGRDELRYKQPKIFIRQSLSGKKIIEAAYTQDRDCYCDNSVYVINQKSEEYCLYYLLALLNSPLMTYYARAKNILTKGSSGSAIRLPMGRNKGLGLKNFPVKRISPDEQIVLIDLVKNILLATESEDYLKDSAKQASAKQYQKQIDQMVYNLYGLTADEIAIVEKSS